MGYIDIFIRSNQTPLCMQYVCPRNAKKYEKKDQPTGDVPEKPAPESSEPKAKQKAKAKAKAKAEPEKPDDKDEKQEPPPKKRRGSKWSTLYVFESVICGKPVHVSTG